MRLTENLLLIIVLLGLPSLPAAAEPKTPADYVDPRIDTAKSRWFYFSSACRPFGMVNLSPDTRTGGDWMYGYLYDDTKIRCFSHIHCWQLYGIAVLPVTGDVPKPWDMDATAATFSHDDEVIHPGYHKVVLKNYGITAELTSTCRVGFHRYTFPKDKEPKIIFNTGATLLAPISKSLITSSDNGTLVGEVVMAPTPRRPKPFPVRFHIEFDRPFDKLERWIDYKWVPHESDEIEGKNAGAILTFPKSDKPLLMKVAISYVNVSRAATNLQLELNHWDFDRVVRESRNEWNRWLSRIEVEGGSEAQKTKFYSDLWHALLGRRIVSDVDGTYADMTGEKPSFRSVGKPFRMMEARDEPPRFPHYNFDALWGSHWSLNILWSFAYPEVMDGFCNTMVDMYKNGGLIPRGPSGGNYTFVMIGDPAARFFAAAYNKGIRNYDIKAAYEGLVKNARPGGIRDHAGYEHGKNASGGGMKYYVERGYVPQGIEGKGMHKDSASMTLEYAYEDWCLAQFALALGHKDDAEWLLKRSQNYRNLWDASTQSMRPRNKDGSWLTPFERAGPRAATGFTEANAAIYTHFVPQDVPGLIQLFGGPEKYVAALDEQFQRAAKDNFVAADREKHHLAWVDYGNQPSTAMAHMFNLAGAPWLSQKWARAVKQQTFGDITPCGGYLGDEDQGQMGALSALLAIGLFDVQGGASLKPTYQITAPVFDRVTIHLNPDYFGGRDFTIIARNNKPENIYIQRAWLNGKPLERYWFDHADLVRGGKLELELGSEPNRAWGVGE